MRRLRCADADVTEPHATTPCVNSKYNKDSAGPAPLALLVPARLVFLMTSLLEQLLSPAPATASAQPSGES